VHRQWIFGAGRTLAWLAIDVDLLMAGVIEVRSEEEGVPLVPVASGG